MKLQQKIFNMQTWIWLLCKSCATSRIVTQTRAFLERSFSLPNIVNFHMEFEYTSTKKNGEHIIE